jgi:NAD(P)-dependent dehydrogenase (short-subunit alcohol dehydrogenase family)
MSETLIFGAAGGIGSAFATLLPGATLFSRHSTPPLDLLDEATIAAAAASIKTPPTLILIATGTLHTAAQMPEKTFGALSPDQLARNFAINAIGPALILKHFLPRLPRDRASLICALSAKVGSITDNAAGGWYSYRASKAALNQLIRTAAIELARKNPNACLVAMHPGTVATPLSAPFAKSGLTVRPPPDAAAQMLATLRRLTAADTGKFWNYDGTELPW